MQLTAIHHIAIIVSDYNRSKDFYVNKLGFLSSGRTIARKEMTGNRICNVEI